MDHYHIDHVMSLRTIVLTVFYEALLIGFWFIDHALVSLNLSSFNLTFKYQASSAMVLPVCRHDEVHNLLSLVLLNHIKCYRNQRSFCCL